MPKYVLIDGTRYSYSEAERRCRLILYLEPAGTKVSDPDHEAFIRALFLLHPEYDDKVQGRAVKHFIRDKAKHGTICFYAVLDDGSKVRFSFKSCLAAALVREDEEPDL